ncbi:MAG TPA: hypothetical protein VFJ08_07110 [Salinisphaera sp.]|nr:hypothetical protein [Salinisphaera sp.]
MSHSDRLARADWQSAQNTPIPGVKQIDSIKRGGKAMFSVTIINFPRRSEKLP